MSIVVAALYQFTKVKECQHVKDTIFDACVSSGVKGTLLLATEGINGTISGSAEGIEAVVSTIKRVGFDGLELKYSSAVEDPFLRMKVVIKPEIVTLGEAVDPCGLVGEYVTSKDWNALIQREDVLLIDTRNDYEYALGHFKGAENPNTTCFREFPKYVKALDKKKYTTVAMYCTGGIRCEKASSYMLQQGFEKLYHLKGGILQYLEDIPFEESLWVGDCFVFDRRVALGHGLALTGYTQCFACRRALSPQEILQEDYVEGVSCLYCIDQHDQGKKTALAERQLQVTLAKERNQQHIGTI